MATCSANPSPLVTIYEALKTAPPYADTTLPTTYDYSPFVPKAVWAELGDAVVQREQHAEREVQGSQYIVMRLDGHHFGTTLTELRKIGVLPATGYCTLLGDIMQCCTRELVRERKALCGFTQSDEITVIIPAQPYDERRKRQYPHEFNGRLKKLETYSAAFVSQCFMKYVCGLWYRKQVEEKLDAVKSGEHPLNLLQTLSEFQVSLVFDARCSAYSTLQEAFACILWRAYDCSVNGISSGVYFAPTTADRPATLIQRMMREPSIEKLKWLHAQHLLPLDPHQAYGSFFYHRLETQTAVNRHTQATVHKQKRVLMRKGDGALLSWVVQDGLLDDVSMKARLQVVPVNVPLEV